ncbi:hypothetical protein PFISCL1PPCAC_53, partial [Pristionchus fissidentatus]
QRGNDESGHEKNENVVGGASTEAYSKPHFLEVVSIVDGRLDLSLDLRNFPLRVALVDPAIHRNLRLLRGNRRLIGGVHPAADVYSALLTVEREVVQL